MQKDETALYWIMLGVSLAFSVAAIVTLLPDPAASKPNVLGYRSVCSFAPAATALCCFLAGLTCTLRNRLVSRRAASMRWRPLIVPVAVALPLLAAALVFGIRFGRAEAAFAEVIARTEAPAASVGAYPDGTRSATASEAEVSATVEVTVREGRIASMRLAGGRNVDDDLAAEIFERVKNAGSTEVDAVSGATASSNVLLKAVSDAASSGP